ncbi:MAG: NAD-dependent epimerase/dehydratase family protein, partial [Mycetocola sp.]
MTDPRAVIWGASGFLGQAIAAALREDGYRVALIGRGPEVDAHWGDPRAIAEVISGAELVINLAGKSVNARYTDASRDTILDSRVSTTRELREAVLSAERPPRLWMNASTATIYRHAVDRPQTERT